MVVTLAVVGARTSDTKLRESDIYFVHEISSHSNNGENKLVQVLYLRYESEGCLQYEEFVKYILNSATIIKLVVYLTYKKKTAGTIHPKRGITKTVK